MGSIRIGLAVLTLLLVMVFNSGCTGNHADSDAVMTHAPVPAAVDLRDKGFIAYINGNYIAALDLYNQSLAADPKYTRAWIEKGNVLVKLNRTVEAVSSYDSALALENDLELVWNSRGEALMSIGNYTEALNSFDNVLRIAPNSDIAKQNRELVLKRMSTDNI